MLRFASTPAPQALRCRMSLVTLNTDDPEMFRTTPWRTSTRSRRIHSALAFPSCSNWRRIPSARRSVRAKEARLHKQILSVLTISAWLHPNRHCVARFGPLQTQSIPEEIAMRISVLLAISPVGRYGPCNGPESRSRVSTDKHDAGQHLDRLSEGFRQPVLRGRKKRHYTCASKRRATT